MEHFNLLECIHNHNNIEDWHCFHNNHHHHNCRHHCWSHRYKNHLPLREKNVWVFFTLSLSDLVSAESQVDPTITGVSALVKNWPICKQRNWSKHQCCQITRSQRAILVSLWSYKQIAQILSKADTLVINVPESWQTQVFT